MRKKEGREGREDEESGPGRRRRKKSGREGDWLERRKNNDEEK